MPARLLLSTLVVLFALPPLTAHADTWVITRLKNRGVEMGAVATFSDLLQTELGQRTGVGFATTAHACGDVPCAVSVGDQLGAEVAVFGAVATLGRKIVVTVTVVECHDAQVISNQRMTVDNVEDLDAVASRMAEAIVTGQMTEDTAQLGSITRHERTPPRRRAGDSGLGLRVAGVLGLGDSLGGDLMGVGLEVSYWFETLHFAIEPRLAAHFSTAVGEERSFFEVPIDLGAYYIFGLGDFTPFVGGGVGVHYVTETRPIRRTDGAVLIATSVDEVDDSGWGFHAFARLGMLLMRTYDVRVKFSVEYGATFIELNRVSPVQSLTFGAGVIF